MRRNVSMTLESDALTVRTVARMFREHAKRVYVRTDGTPTRHHANIGLALDRLEDLHGGMPAGDLDPRALKAVRTSWVTGGLTRNTINKQVRYIRQVWDWAAEMDLVDEAVAEQLHTVKNLPTGMAPEGKGVRPADLEDVRATIAELPEPLANMVRFLLLPGCRVGEAREARADEVIYCDDGPFLCPQWHKTARYDKVREIPLNAPAYALVSSLEDREYLFGVGDGSRPYQRDSLINAINRVCRRTGITKWSPGQLRHNAATGIFRAHGLEATASVLGHSSTRVTSRYVHARNNKQAMGAAGALSQMTA